MMRRSCVITFATLLVTSPALAQDPLPWEGSSWSWSQAPPPPPPKPKTSAGVVFAMDVGAAIPIRSPDTKTAGFGIDVRLGYRFAAGPIWIAPQFTTGWVDFPEYDWAVRLGLGGQVGVDAGLVEPSVYAFAGGFVNLWKSGPGVRAGASLDFRPRYRLSVGVHADYDTASWDTGSVRYVSPGAHLGWVF